MRLSLGMTELRTRELCQCGNQTVNCQTQERSVHWRLSPYHLIYPTDSIFIPLAIESEAKKIGVPYLEVSALHNVNVDILWETLRPQIEFSSADGGKTLLSPNGGKLTVLMKQQSLSCENVFSSMLYC